MAQWFAKTVYNSSEWERVRKAAWQRDHGLCQECLRRGRVQAAHVVHHIEELALHNIDDPNVCYGLDNLECVCTDCHARLHGSGEERPDTNVPMFDALGNLTYVRHPA